MNLSTVAFIAALPAFAAVYWSLGSHRVRLVLPEQVAVHENH